MTETIKNISLLNYMEGPTALELNGNEITTNLGIIYRDPDILIRPNYVYMDTNNVPEGPKMLEAAGYGKPLQVWGQPYVVSSGFSAIILCTKSISRKCSQTILKQRMIM